MNTLVSIILPTLNGANRIKRAIESVMAQSYTSWELLVIDDGSTDNTAEVIREFSLRDFRVRYIKNDINLDIQKTLNRGIALSRGQYIARIDDDDIWIDIEKLEQQVAFLNKNTDHVLIGTGLIAVTENGEEVFRFIPPQSDADIRAVILNKTSFTHSSVVFKKSAVLDVGRYATSVETQHIEDYDLWLKLGSVGKFANLSIYGVQLVLRESGLSSRFKILQFKNSLNLIKQYRYKYPGYIKSYISLWFRMIAYSILQIKLFRSLYSKIYKLYKNL